MMDIKTEVFCYY